MPKTCQVSPLLVATLNGQDGVIHRSQALGFGLTTGAIKARLRYGHWRSLLPEVYLSNAGEPTWRQRLVAAQLYAGPDSAIDGVSACYFYGIRAFPVDRERVFVVAPFGSTARSRGFVVARRTTAPMSVQSTEFVRYLEPAAAVIAATRRMRRARSVLATLSDAVQRGVVTHADLVRANIQGPPRNARFADDALEQLAAGVRSAPEGDFRTLASASAILPPLEYNVWVRLPCGRVVCLDALIESSAVVHETNGRAHHAREDLFADMQERHDAVTAGGFIVLHNPPRRIRDRPREVIAEVERCHRLYEGRGMPPGVVRLSIAA
jgi:hypothetical protein